MLRRKSSQLFLLLFLHKPSSSPLLYPLSYPHNLHSRPNYSSPASIVSSSSLTTVESGNAYHLTPDELKQINLLIPRLCESNHLHEAIRLIDTVLPTKPPLESLSLSVLIDRLSAEPDMAQSMSFLNRLKHNPISNPSHILHINKLLLTSYIKKRRCKEAIKILNWISRPDSPCSPDVTMYRMAVKGLCRERMTFEALNVVKSMVQHQVKEMGSPGYDDDVRDCVCRSLLREARIREAQDLNQAFFNCTDSDGQAEVSLGRVLDQIISNWTD